ncbi:MAG: WXG100 family type VII secretion target [Nocardioides sp.]
MTPTTFAIDLDQLTDTIAMLSAAGHRCDDALDLIAARMARLHGSWSGSTALAQSVSQARWEAGFVQMTEGLAAMRAAAQTADRNYRAAVDTNVKLWTL